MYGENKKKKLFYKVNSPPFGKNFRTQEPEGKKIKFFSPNLKYSTKRPFFSGKTKYAKEGKSKIENSPHESPARTIFFPSFFESPSFKSIFGPKNAFLLVF